MKMNKEMREWWRVQVESSDPKTVVFPVVRSQLRNLLDDLDEAEKERDEAIAKRNEYSVMYVDMELEMGIQKDYRIMAEEDVGRWKKVVDTAFGHEGRGYQLYLHDGKTTEQVREEFVIAAHDGNLDAIEVALGIKKEGV